MIRIRQAFRHVVLHGSYLKVVVIPVLFTCFALPKTIAQPGDINLSGSFNQMPFHSFADSMQALYHIRFFYDPAWTGDLVIRHSGETQLDQVLRQTLSGKSMYFVRDSEGNYIFTRNFLIVKGLSEKILLPSRAVEPDSLTLAARQIRQSESKGRKSQQNGTEWVVVGSHTTGAKEAVLSGFVTGESTGDPIIGAAVQVQELKTGVMTDVKGYYVLNIPPGRYTLTVHSLGMQDAMARLVVNGSGTFHFRMGERITQLKDVTVVADRGNAIASMHIGVEKLDMKTVRQLPTSLGEADIVKVALLLPGVQTVGEGASGFNVRGGSTDQNLFILNGAPVFNTSHLFGFFSVFNPDVVRDFELYKSGIPAQYGGRVSSVFDVQSRSGNLKKYSVAGGISPVTLRLTAEGPLLADKMSFVIGARTTYSDWILKQINKPEIKNSRGSFYDLNGKLHYEINKKNTIELTGYTSHDFFKLNFDTSYEYNSGSATLHWKHHLSNTLVSNLSALWSHYDYRIESKNDPLNAFRMDYSIEYHEAKAELSWYPSHNHKVLSGVSNIWYTLSPGNMRPLSRESVVGFTDLEREKAMETSLFLSEQYDITGRLSVYAGMRGVLFSFMGPKTVFGYYGEGPKNETTLKDTTRFGRGRVIQTYLVLEPRISLRWMISPVSSLKLSYNRMNQFLHMMSNTTAISPTDTWKLSDSHTQPQTGDQFAAGWYLGLRKNTIEVSVEAYYKNLKRITDYKGGARLLMNDKLETVLLNGKGKAYGVEIMVKKPMGKLNGWISYTWSRVIYQVNGSSLEEKINNGEPFPANHDKPHDFTLVQNYRFSRRFSISNNFVYSTGRPITYPVGKWSNDLLYYSKRNEYRIPDYWRWDFSANLDGNLKSKKLAHGSWSLSVYNVTGRFNVYSIYFKTEKGQVKGYMLSIFARPIITLGYHFRF